MKNRENQRILIQPKLLCLNKVNAMLFLIGRAFGLVKLELHPGKYGGWILEKQFLFSKKAPGCNRCGRNLISGMAWLQGTFATRFNRFRGERGHVFQSRYKSILIEEGRPLLELVNYIPLNPVRAGLRVFPS